jgi:hypothetical protein
MEVWEIEEKEPDDEIRRRLVPSMRYHRHRVGHIGGLDVTRVRALDSHLLEGESGKSYDEADFLRSSRLALKAGYCRGSAHGIPIRSIRGVPRRSDVEGRTRQAGIDGRHPLDRR